MKKRKVYYATSDKIMSFDTQEKGLAYGSKLKKKGIRYSSWWD